VSNLLWRASFIFVARQLEGKAFQDLEGGCVGCLMSNHEVLNFHCNKPCDGLSAITPVTITNPRTSCKRRQTTKTRLENAEMVASMRVAENGNATHMMVFAWQRIE
jgi:hypothetical protein